VYLAPPTVPSPSVVTVRATSVATPTASGTASVTILPQPSITSVSPSSFTTGPFSATVNGAGFVTGAVVTFDGVALPTTFVSPVKLTVTGTAGAAKPSVPVIATMPDGATSNVAFVDVTAAAHVSIKITPTKVEVRLNRTRQFTATVQGTANTSVIWKVNGLTGGSATVGTITTSGLYRGPAVVPTPDVVTVTATAAADTTRTATAWVRLKP
jgi:ribosomal protein L11